ncbi:MAG: hypothetical protein HY862_12500 [Chloroflexi bacterium]|nr:hypothetical protein [Chloroflexota bacterium]
MDLLPPASSPPSEGSFFVRYLRLYVLHQVEHTTFTNLSILRTRIATVRYIFNDLPNRLDQQWQADSISGVSLAQETLIPRFENLLADDQAWARLGLTGGDYPAWQPYLSLRQTAPGKFIDALPSPRALVPNPPSLPAPLARPMAHLMVNVERAQRLLEVTQTALQVADTALRVWNNWKLGQAERKLLEARYVLLQDSIHATLSGQQTALNQSLEPGFVTGYLAAHGDDDAYDVLFGDVS